MQRIRALPSSVSDADDRRTTLDALEHYNPDSHPCQRCGKKIWHSGKAASYRRGLTYIKDGMRVDDEVNIPIFLCEECGKSSRPGGNPDGDYYHAILPNNLIPFTYYTLLFVLSVLDAYVKREQPVTEICSFFSISVSTLYRWKKRYIQQYDAWAESLESIRHMCEHSSQSDPEQTEAEALSQSLRKVFSCLPQLVSSFFSRFAFSFLQHSRLTHFRPLLKPRRL